MAFGGMNSMNNSTGLDNEYTIDFKKMLDRISVLEVTNHAMWLMLKNKGFTDEEFDAAMATAHELSKQNLPVTGLRCPNCGKSAQISKTYRIKCIYCGADAIIHPYEVYEIATAQAEEAAATPEETPYDLNSDLRFDDLM